jgi:hypothetical protein
MRLTVGPLPPGVYWRRRAVVLVLLASVVLVISYACGGPRSPAAGAQTNQSPAPATSPDASPTLLRPVVPTTPTPDPTAFTLPASGATGACTDAEMQVTATAGSAEVQTAKPLGVTIKLKNVSSRTCTRDIGADMQELRLVQGTTIVWSSDDCNANAGHDNTSFAAGKEVSFTLTWAGRVSRTGIGAVTCSATAQPPPPGIYQLVARLDKKLSAPFAVHITS